PPRSCPSVPGFDRTIWAKPAPMGRLPFRPARFSFPSRGIDRCLVFPAAFPVSSSPLSRQIPRAANASVDQVQASPPPLNNGHPISTSCNPMKQESRARCLRHLPAARWLAGYRIDLLPVDAVAGVTLAAYAIPVSLAYAALAGLPPQAGIYGYLLGGLGYALLGSSRQLAIGPTSAISLMIAGTVATMADRPPQRYVPT